MRTVPLVLITAATMLVLSSVPPDSPLSFWPWGFAALALLPVAWWIARAPTPPAFHEPPLPPRPPGHHFRDSPELAEAFRLRYCANLDPERVERMIRQFGFTFSEAGNFHTHPDPAAIDALIDATYAPADRDAARKLLKHYDAAEHDLERTRMCIIKLSNGDIQRTRELIRIAREDWRDVLVMAESPTLYAAIADSVRHDDPITQATLDAWQPKEMCDRDQLVEWLYAHTH